MPQLLPPFPNLEHLKGQAKDVLRAVRQRYPAWKLAHAQHAVARGYGFSSWPDLKTHIESLRQHSPESPRRPRNSDGERADCREHPLAGTWVLNPSRSKIQTSHSLHDGVMLEFSQAGGTVTMTQVVVDSTRLDMAIRLAIRTDGSGNSQPVRFGKGLVLEARLAGAQRLDAVIRSGDDIVSQGTYEVSSDRQTLAFTTSSTLIVFDRVGVR